MKLKSKLLLALLAASAASFANAEEAADPLAFNVGVVSEYRYRGMGQSRGEPALQGGADYTHSSGLYVGAWASSIQWIRDSGAFGSTELDVYGGYKFEAAGLGYDVGVLRYQYLGNTLGDVAGAINPNTTEMYGAATAGPVTLKYSYSLTDLFGALDSRGSEYWDLSATFDLGQGYSLVPHAGRQYVKNNSAFNYTDVALTLNKDLGDGLSASVSAVKSSLDYYYPMGGPANTGYNAGKSALVVGVKYTF